MAVKRINVTLRIWRQSGPNAEGHFETYEMREVSTAISFLEMLDALNNRLEKEGKEPVAFDHDCREGICGACGAVINGDIHGPQAATTLCQLHMRQFRDGQTLIIEPFRAEPFPVVRDLAVDRSAFDRIIQAGGFITVRTGQAPDAHAILVRRTAANKAMDAAQCIGCGACVAACPNASASLFVSAKISHLSYLPQGHPERRRRALAMITQMDQEGFGSCSKHYECEAVCPKGIKVSNIARMNREFLVAALLGPE
ncbi:MAG TPA: succinate dehydrogenase/fumarate reductase iron-sulfur subunit [Candidatus Hydrogenedentes bacterium]|nr:succinate dehydrogenase/fumarate reductase iron-sulfur subunit [Candidatus Hydrogenedentota bacterium]HNT86664.1 succinate dehydrogenase/fumarate reductase iron-sulfur subunit [Candidatus Hydrogenedentota bacterium]